jgi:ParB-like chromosome segregation protein Spo0J
MATPDSSPVFQETMTIATSSICERFAPLRITDPEAERAMLRSMEKYGQLTPVVVCRINSGEHELLDGFKRLRVAGQLGRHELAARTLNVSIRACKAAMLQLNRVGRAISGMEEALVVHSLCHEDGLNQVEIALLLGRHKSWVCRRLMLIERLSDEAQDSIRLGLLPASIGAELSRLQRCNQERLLGAIREQGLTWRETRQVVAALLIKPGQEHDAILKNPREALLIKNSITVPPVNEQGLNLRVRQLLRHLFTLEKSCMDVTHLFSSTELCQFETHEEQRVRSGCARTLASLGHAQKALQENTPPGGNGNGHIHSKQGCHFSHAFTHLVFTPIHPGTAC